MLVYFLPFIILLGIVTSVEDYKYHKIRNKWIIISLVAALVINTGLILYYFILTRFLDFEYIQLYLINLLISIGIAYFLWEIRFCKPGDSKLFIAYAALIPLSVYSSTNLPYFPALIILINAVVPFFIYVSIRSLVTADKRDLKQSFERLWSIRFLTVLFTFIFVSAVAGNIRHYLKLDNFFSSFFFTFLLYFIVSAGIIAITKVIIKKTKTKILNQKQAELLLIAIFLITVFLFGFKAIYSDPGVVFMGVLYGVMYYSIRYMVMFLNKKTCVHKVRIDDLREGMILVEKLYLTDHKIIKLADEDKSMQSFVASPKEGLSKEELSKITEEYRKKRIFSVIASL